MPAKTLILIQHCQSRHHLDPAIRRGPDGLNGLTDLGRQQAGQVAARMRQWVMAQSCRLYSSDMTRAWQTAEIIGGVLDRSPLAVPELREYCSYPIEGKVPDSPRGTPDDRAWFLFDSRPEPNLETWREFHARVCAGMARIVCEHPVEAIPILVVHGGTLSNIVVWWLGLPLEVLPEREPFSGAAGNISVLRTNRYGSHVVERLNDKAHLDAADAGRPVSLSS